jgi:hypothetical protein
MILLLEAIVIDIHIHIPAKQRVPNRSLVCCPTEPTTRPCPGGQIWTISIVDWEALGIATELTAGIAIRAV